MLYSLESALIAVDASDSDNFIALVIASGLDPASDFRNSNFEGMDFSDCSLQGFDFTGSDFTKATLGNADFRGAVLEGALFASNAPPIASTRPSRDLKSVLSSLIDLATEEGRAEVRADAIREIDRLFPSSPVARSFIRERRSADKSRSVRNLAWRLSGDTSHPSLPLFETMVRGLGTESSRVALSDLIKKTDIDGLEYELLFQNSVNRDSNMIAALDRKGFLKTNVERSIAYLISNVFRTDVRKVFSYIIENADENQISLVSDVILSYPEERYGFDDKRPTADIIATASAHLFDRKGSAFYQNLSIANRILEDGIPLSPEFCRMFFGRGPLNGIDDDLYFSAIRRPTSTYSFENIMSNWIDGGFYISDIRHDSGNQYKLKSDVLSLVLNYHPFGVSLRSNNWYSDDLSKSPLEISIAKDFVDFHGIQRRNFERRISGI